MVVNVIAALLTQMLVEVNDPVSGNVIEWGVLLSLMTSSDHAYLHRHIAPQWRPSNVVKDFGGTLRVRSLQATGMTLNWFQRQKWKVDIP